ncbi:MAG TPA: DUF5668 domain-containing protein [Acidobacteriota bacterium]|nr:DUF5668 domain-containing protein [Acidobacteriota bacterium]
MSQKRHPSLLGALLWLGVGILFLLRNFGIGPDFWSMAARYWPILLILLGLGKVIDYYRHKEGVSLRVGEVVGIFILLLIGTAITRVSESPISQAFRDWSIPMGDSSVHPGQWLGTSYTYTQEATYPMSSTAPIRIENAYGLVSVTPGSDGEVRVRLKKVVYTSEESKAKGIADQIRLEAGPQANEEPGMPVKAEVEPKGKSRGQLFVVKNNRDALAANDYRFNTDMEVFVPKRTDLTVRNSFGELRVSNVDGKLDLETTHNALELRDCSGEFKVSNRYAESRLTNLTGNLNVEARGHVYVEAVKGDVIVRDEYSPVEITDVTGQVTVSNTESNVRLDKITKAVVVDARGTQVNASELGSTLKVTTNHRRLEVSDVASNIVLDCQYSTVSLKDIRGNVDLSTNSDRITADGIRGYLKVKGQGSGIRANSVDGPVEIQTTLKDVIVNNFGGSCTVANEYADVSLSTGTLGKGDIAVKNHNGGIDLFIPEGAPFQIDATARNGRVASDYAGLEPSQGAGDVGLLKAKLKGGGPKILLDTEYSNINIRARGSEGDAGSKVESEPGSRQPRRARRAEAVR